MRGIVFRGDRQVEVKTFPTPEPGFGEVRVRMMATGICGSDLHIYRERAERFAGKPERIPGHEPAGIVEALGAGVTRLKVGDRVCINHYLSCGHCVHCASGMFQWCAEARGYGGPIDGSHADYVLATERNCVLLPDAVSFEDGAFVACAGGTAYSALLKLGVSGRTTLAVFGLGPVGLSGVLLGKAFGATVIGIDVIDERVRLAERIGADAVVNASEADPLEVLREVGGGEGCDVAFEASGSTAGRRNAIACLRRGGKVVFCGVGSDEEILNPTEIISRELTLMGSFVLSLRGTYDLVDFLARRGITFEPIVTHRFRIEEGIEAYRIADASRTGKVLFTWE